MISIPLLISLTITSAFAAESTRECKCVPDDSCWPTADEFSALNDTLAGNLIQGVPPASVCYESEPNYNEEACDIIRTSWFSSTFHASDPISIGWPWFANNSCPPIYPNGTSVTGDPDAGKKGCSIGAYPIYSVNATTEEHVVEAVKWVAEKNIRLVIKSTGHSFQGRNTGYGSIVIWTHHMRGSEWHDNFQADQCASNGTSTAMTFAAGERVRNVYEAADKHDSVVVAGSAQDVGIMGWFTGGGHGPLSSTYGLGVDNVLQIRIVTPDGSLMTANRCVNPDLFWAVRGGGGSTFGVVTSVTMKAYPSPRVSRQYFTLSLANPKNETGFWELVAETMSELPRLKEGGMQGYSLLIPPVSGVNPYGGPDSSPTWTWAWLFDVHDKPNGTIESLFAPIAERLDPKNGITIIYTSTIVHAPDFFTLWNSTIGFEAVASGGAVLGSRFLTTDSLTLDVGHLTTVLKNITAPAKDGSYPFIQPHMIANSRSDLIDEVSATPAWRKAVLHFIVVEGFKDSDTFEEVRPTIDRLTYQKVAALKSLAPESGAYFNEGDEYDPNWQYTFWGKNYPRLSEIKEQYDPHGLLWCISCVGSEKWEAVGKGQLCPVPWVSEADHEEL